MKGGLAINMMPIPTKNTLSMSTLKMGSLIKSLAKNTVYNGEVAVIIITLANGKCWNYIFEDQLSTVCLDLLFELAKLMVKLNKWTCELGPKNVISIL